MDTAVIFTDGSSRGNPGPGGWGAIVATDDDVKEIGGGENRTTNNRMELMAVIEGLRVAKRFSTDSITIYSDSAYVINGATTWVQGWKLNGWKTKEKSDVLNKDLWEALAQEITEAKNIVWHKVGGHADIPGNERADEIATNFAANKKIMLYEGGRKTYAVDIARIAHDDVSHAKRAESRARSNQKAFSYVSLVRGKVMVHKTWDECKRRVEGKPARFKKALSPGDEANILKEFSARL